MSRGFFLFRQFVFLVGGFYEAQIDDERCQAAGGAREIGCCKVSKRGNETCREHAYPHAEVERRQIGGGGCAAHVMRRNIHEKTLYRRDGHAVAYADSQCRGKKHRLGMEQREHGKRKREEQKRAHRHVMYLSPVDQPSGDSLATPTPIAMKMKKYPGVAMFISFP